MSEVVPGSAPGDEVERARVHADEVLAASYNAPGRLLLSSVLCPFVLGLGLILLTYGTFAGGGAAAAVFGYVLGLPLTYLGLRMLAAAARWTVDTNRDVRRALRDVREAERAHPDQAGGRGLLARLRDRGLLPALLAGLVVLALNILRLASDLT